MSGSTAGKCFLFLGPELGEKHDALNRLRSAILKNNNLEMEKNSDPFEEIHFYSGETELSKIVSIIKNGSLFSDFRFIIIKNAEFYKKKNETEQLVFCIKNLAANTILVLDSEETRLDKNVEEAVPRENKTVFWELFENKKKEWLYAFFKRQGCGIDESGVLTILEMVENNTDALNRECNYLILFLGKDKIITGSDIEQCLARVREESAFTLFSAIAKGNLSLSLEILHSLLASKYNFQSVTMSLAWSFRKLRDYLDLKIAENGTAGEIELKKIGITTAKNRIDYANAAKQWPICDGALALISQYEYLLRSSGAAWEGILLDQLVLHLARGIVSR